jgi:hypothetical protein
MNADKIAATMEWGPRLTPSDVEPQGTVL